MSRKKGRSMAGLPWIAAMAFFMQALDATILNTALPAIAHSLNRSPLAMQSAIISYTLTVAMLIPVSGWLADRFGTRRVFIIAVSLFTLASGTELCDHARSGGADTGPGARRGVCHLGQLALDFPDKHSHRGDWHSVCPQIHAKFHDAAQALRYNRFSVIWLKPGTVFQRY